MDSQWYVLLPLGGLVAGLIDSIAGGGGLVSLPLLSIVLGPGAHAVGSNKIVGSTGSLAAFLVYLRAGHMDWTRSLKYGLFVAMGSFLGSSLTPLIPPGAFRWILLGICPVLLWLVWNKGMWKKLAHPDPHEPSLLRYACWGVLAGLYDGAIGPGGGTLMFLGLIFGLDRTLLMALAATKFVNFISASVAWGNFAYHGYVHWAEGSLTALGMIIGEIIGARYATQNAEKIVRPLLAVVSVLLLLKLFL